jgi:hypothetical protein
MKIILAFAALLGVAQAQVSTGGSVFVAVESIYRVPSTLMSSASDS